MIKILSIGNSFSVDAHTYFHKIATSAGVELRTTTLYIGGCSFERHFNNMISESPETHGICDYEIQESGVMTSVKTTLKAGLLMDDWDIITLQQASGFSGKKESYHPYADELCAYVRKLCPNAKIHIHQTWAYEKDSTNVNFPLYDCNQDKMHRAVVEAYSEIAKDLGADGIIPCGELIAELRKNEMFDIEKGGESLCRDGFHLHYVYGRFAAAATWFEYLLGGNIYDSTFIPANTIRDNEGNEKVLEGMEEKLEFIKKVVHGFVAEKK